MSMKTIVLCSLWLPMSLFSREITGLQVNESDDGSATVTVTMTAGEAGDGHVLYYVWTNDGTDKGSDILAWPNVLRVGRVADDATSESFTLPSDASLTGQYACRVFFATSPLAFDYYVEGVRAVESTACYVNTRFYPVGGKTSLFIDLMLTTAKTQYYILGSNNSAYTLCAYVNGNGYWAFASNNGGGSWSNPTTLSATKERTVITIDTTVVEDEKAKSVFTVTTPSASAVRESFENHSKTATLPLILYGRCMPGEVNDKKCAATIYRCSITNDGVCVRDFYPCVSNSVAGLYDGVNNVFYPSSGTEALTAVGEKVYGKGVHEEDSVEISSPVWKQSVSDYVTDEPYVENLSLKYTTGGTKAGNAPLTLTGVNDWGGTFTVNEGTLVADFGQGLAETDNVVLRDGTFRTVSDTFTCSLGTGGGEVSVADDAQSAGFSAYGGPLTVRLWNDASLLLEMGSALFPAKTLVLNDAWADNVLTFDNGITGDGSAVTVRTDNATAVISGAVTNVGNIVRRGSGTLYLNGETNAFSIFIPLEGTTVIAPPEGQDTCYLDFECILKSTNSVSTLVISNAVTTHHGGASVLYYGNTEVRFIGGSLKSDGIWYVANRSGPSDDTYSGETGKIVFDGVDADLSNDFLPGYYSYTKKWCKADIVVTNNATLDVDQLNLRHGTMRQYSGKVKVNFNSGGAIRMATTGSGDFTYYLYGGVLEQAAGNQAATFSLGFSNNESTYPVAILFVHKGGEFIAKGSCGFIGRYVNDTGKLYLDGGRMSMPRASANLRVGYGGSGLFEVSNGGEADIAGSVHAVALSGGRVGRTGTVSILSRGILRTGKIISDCTNDTANLILDGGIIVPNSAASGDFIYGFTSAKVGVDGATVDTAGRDIVISQDFSACEDQIWPLDGIESPDGGDLVSAAAFAKAGEGVLTLTGSNAWICATCVSNGTLAASGEFSLPPATTLQLQPGGVLDLCGKTHTVSNLVGCGVVSNGSLTVTGTIWPGYPEGVLELKGVTLSAKKLAYEFTAEGKCGRLKSDGALDLGGVEIEVVNPEARERGGMIIVEAASVSGTPVSDLAGGNALNVSGNTVRVGMSGLRFFMR